VIYFDTAFIAKCYLNEVGAERVRAAAQQAKGLVSCELARVEFASLLRRHVREGFLSPQGLRLVRRNFEQDEQDRVLNWLPINSALVEATTLTLEKLPPALYLRSGDALHLECARHHGYAQIYSNDRHLLAAAPHFALEGINLAA